MWMIAACTLVSSTAAVPSPEPAKAETVVVELRAEAPAPVRLVPRWSELLARNAIEGVRSPWRRPARPAAPDAPSLPPDNARPLVFVGGSAGGDFVPLTECW
ncbi:MAG: hypothetical protein AAF658_14425 [Myxococcota bacterium]